MLLFYFLIILLDILFFLFIMGVDNYKGYKSTKKVNNMTQFLFEGAKEIPYHQQKGSSKPVLKIKDGVVVSKYNSIYEAARDNNIYASNISDVLHGRHKQTHGYTWKYDGYDMVFETKTKKKANSISTRQCKVIFEKKFETEQLADNFIKDKNLTEAKIIFTRNRSKKQ